MRPFYGWTVVGAAFVVLLTAHGAHAGALVGSLFALAGCTAARGPLVAGATHDATGSYRAAFLGSTGLNVVAVALLAVCRPPRRWVAGAAA